MNSVLPKSHPNIAILHTDQSVMLAAEGEFCAQVLARIGRSAQALRAQVWAAEHADGAAWIVELPSLDSLQTGARLMGIRRTLHRLAGRRPASD